MKSLLKLIVLIFLFATSGCGGGSENANPLLSLTIPQPGSGPGDQKNYFPADLGNTWEYQGVKTTNNQGATSYHRTTSVTGNKLVNGINATVINVVSSLDSGSIHDEYFYKTGNGVFSYGNNDPSDVVTSQLSPYPQLIFPVTTGTSFAQYIKNGLDSGEDLDNDGINDKVNLSATTTVAGIENIALSIGTFPSTVRLVQTVNYQFMLSSTKQTVSATETNVIYLAGGVGIIKQSQNLSIPAANYTLAITEELSGYIVNGLGKGVVSRRTLATGVAIANSDIYSPGVPSVANNGTNFLVVAARITNNTSTLFGTVVTPANSVQSTFDIGLGSSPAIAYGNGIYLLAFSQNGQIIINRISSAGNLLDGSTGSTIPTTSQSNYTPTVAFDGTNFLVVWAQFNGDYNIQGALVSPLGQILNQFSVTTAAGEQVEPAVAFDGNNYMVIWRDTKSGSGPAADTNITATRVKSDGTVLDPTGIPVTTATGVQGSPQLCFHNGQYLAVWEDYRSGSAAIYGSRIGSDGTVIDPVGIAIDNSHNSTYRPTVALSGNSFLVLWRVGDYAEPTGIYGTRINSIGQAVSLASGGTIFPISGSPTDSAARFVNPAIATGQDNSLLVWINNREVSGSFKDLQSVLLYPF